MTRHLERIDSEDASAIQSRQWNSVDKKLEMYQYNPYITDVNYEDNSKNREYKQSFIEKRPDVIVSSPFLRCMQTALIIANATGVPNIHIDFGLSEVVDNSTIRRFAPKESADGDRFRGTIPLDVSQIYEYSLEHFRTKETGVDISKFILSNSEPRFIDNESRVDDYGFIEESPDARIVYYDRIKVTLKNINTRFTGKKVLVVTHADAYFPFNDDGKLMSYRQIYTIPIPKLVIMDGGSLSGRISKKYKILWGKVLKL